jgi:hypothetical protein
MNDEATAPTTARTKRSRPRHQGTPEQRRRLFTQALLKGESPQAALTTAGFNLTGRKAIASTISALRKDARIKEILDAETRALDTIVNNTPAQLEEMLTRLARSDFSQLLYPDGTPRPLNEVPPEIRAAVRSYSSVIQTNSDGSVSARKISYGLEPKLPAIENLLELHRLIRDRETEETVAHLFQVTIHTGEEAVRIGMERNRLAHQRPEIETTSEPAPKDEPRQ